MQRHPINKSHTCTLQPLLCSCPDATSKDGHQSQRLGGTRTELNLSMIMVLGGPLCLGIDGTRACLGCAAAAGR